jgi:hypothetical protein
MKAGRVILPYPREKENVFALRPQSLILSSSIFTHWERISVPNDEGLRTKDEGRREEEKELLDVFLCLYWKST